MTAAHVARAALLCVCAQGLFEPLHLAGEWDGLQDPHAVAPRVASPGGTRACGCACAGPGAAAAGCARTARWRALAALGVLLALGSFLVERPHGRRPRIACCWRRCWGCTCWRWRSGSAPLWPLRAAVAQHFAAAGAAAVLQQLLRRAVWLVPLLAARRHRDWPWCCCRMLAALRRPYGLLLCVKALLFAVLLGLAALNRSRSCRRWHAGSCARVPALRRNAQLLEYAPHVRGAGRDRAADRALLAGRTVSLRERRFSAVSA